MAERVERRLAAVLAADVAGYSRLMGADEIGTLAALKALRREIVDPAIIAHKGRIVKTTGDGMLVEFASAVDAVTCAMAVQDKMAERKVASRAAITFRIGINVGDIIIDGDDIFGEGVNIAARVENECEPGGVCLSGSAFEQVRSKTEFAFDDLGEKSLKNIDRPVRVYATRSAASSLPKPLALPDKPSIAVLPFLNMSGDPEQEYFADGMAEDIITALSRFRELFVIARNSSFAYKTRHVDVKQVGRELGVRYVLEGSVRKAGNRVRITGQLIDATTNAHLWADHFDGPLDNVFDLQDEITTCVVGAIAPKLQQAEIERAKRKPTDSLDAYDCYLRGIASLHHWTKDASEEALRLFRKAIDLDPEFSSAYGQLARCQVWRNANGWISEEGERSEAALLARRAVVFGSEDAAALAGGGFALYALANDPDLGAKLIDRALAINPNMAHAWHFSCWVRIALGLPDLALAHELRAMRLSPLDPLLGNMQTAAALAEFSAGRFVEAASWAKMATCNQPVWPTAWGISAASSALAGHQADAETAVERLRQLIPSLRLADLKVGPPSRRAEVLAKYAEGLRKAGVTE